MGEIPKNYKEYKNKLKNKFSGGIYDTKYLYNESIFNFNENKEQIIIKNNIHLECLYTNLTKENNKLSEDKKKDKKEDKKEETKEENKEAQEEMDKEKNMIMKIN